MKCPAMMVGVGCSFLLASGAAHAGLDHKWSLDRSCPWARKYQTGLEDGVVALEVAGSLTLQASFVTPFIANYSRQHPLGLGSRSPAGV